MQDAISDLVQRDSKIGTPLRRFAASQPPHPAPPVRRRATARPAGSENGRASSRALPFSSPQPAPEPSIARFDEIDSPGLYVEHRTGTLIRVLHQGGLSGLEPVIEVVTREPWIVTKISSDPFLKRTRARAIVSELGFYPNF